MAWQRKTFGDVEIKASQGVAEAVISRFDVVDKDGDVTLVDAIPNGLEVPISAYQHTSWQGALPVGRATIRTDRTKAWVEAAFFMSTTSGRDTFEVVKALESLGQWSYGYDALDADTGEFDGQRVRFLKKLAIHEVSPVLLGSGVDTTTQMAKADQELIDQEYAKFVYGEWLRTQRLNEDAEIERSRFLLNELVN